MAATLQPVPQSSPGTLSPIVITKSPTRFLQNPLPDLLEAPTVVALLSDMAEVMSPILADGTIKGTEHAHELVDGETDGESSRLSRSASSAPSDLIPTSPDSSIAQTIESSTASLKLPSAPTEKSSLSTATIALHAPGAEHGFGSLTAENQLREAMIGKDRIFALMLSKEIEDFIGKVSKGIKPKLENLQEPTTLVPLLAFEASIRLTSNPTSKYQRMIIYKAAEWYGIRAIMPLEGQFVIGITDPITEKSSTLRMSDLAPRPPTPKQNFKIMQRVPVGSAGSASSRAGSVAGDENEAGGSKRKTLEQREADYALARERIYGNDEITSATASTTDIEDGEGNRGRTTRRDVEADDDDFVPRQSYGHVQPVYASLYHPKPPVPDPAYDTVDPSYAYQQAHQQFTYPEEQQPPPMTGYGQMSNGYNQQTAYPFRQGGYMDSSSPPFVPHNMYGGPPTWPVQSGQAPPMMPLPQNAWQYGNLPGPSDHAPAMPMIPQGVPPYPQHYGYATPQQPPYAQQHPSQQQQQQRMFNGQIMQPTPMRPGLVPHHHSSTSSSISSRSYQDYSRPHSRGSTTSTRSATSSVRMGAMYPANNNATPHGYRQRGMKSQPLNSLTSLSSGDRRSTRGHSPSSVTSGSSRSSRRASSISVQAPLPGQHQLPTRPDWAANNIPYHPTPMGPPYPGAIPGGPTNPSDFPPLLRNGTAAEPMQVERAKMRPSNGTVWNGAAGRAIQTYHQGPPHPQHFAYPSQAGGQVYPISPALSTATGPQSTLGGTETDPDFPRRTPANRLPGVLYDPSRDNPATISRPVSAVSQVKITQVNGTNIPDKEEMSVEDAIEAKLAALSVSGIAIGPPPKKAPSYAKIVRRD